MSRNPFLSLTALLLMSAIFYSCTSRNTDVDLGKINLKAVEFHRYEKALFAIDPQNLNHGLPAIADEFKIFLGDQYLEPVNVMRLQSFISDTAMQALYRETKHRFPDLSGQSTELTKAFRYFKDYFPEKATPAVYTYISGLDIDHPVRYSDQGLVIGLDLFLGSTEPIYAKSGLPLYKIARMTGEQIVPSCMAEIGRSLVTEDMQKQRMLDLMVAEGKVLYFEELTLPATAENIKIGYTPTQLDWCKSNEVQVWAFLVQNNLLFTTDPGVVGKLLTDGPFTSGFAKESPGRIGIWVGWQIVRNYMQRNPDVTIATLMQETDSQKILEGSHYKPRK
jgi:hypothetical protein